MIAWRAKISGALPITHYGRTEITNTICRCRFTGDLDDLGMEEALADFETDFKQGRLDQVSILWRAALNLSTELSHRHTPRYGTRSADVLHIACALELKLRRFITFDDRQRKLATAAGLKVIAL